jgi:hypothetical protein
LIDVRPPASTSGLYPAVVDGSTQKTPEETGRTHTHSDDTGSNGFFGASVETIVHENTRTNMTKMDAFKGTNAKFVPKRTYTDK